MKCKWAIQEEWISCMEVINLIIVWNVNAGTWKIGSRFEIVINLIIVWNVNLVIPGAYDDVTSSY